ncbi:TetR family transcriptional regulator C-terminal domain-containing protein [Streptomyces sp. NPDC002793]|uniref:TetR/AcrR family transcriptional regulator n=1 Tax=Streptomyces sp. NPDC002793 TaxID=3154432 RepID=UPI00332C3D47
MPKIVDHEARRVRLVEAVWSLTVRGGIEQVSLRKVAEEAGVSMGQIQHYYSSMQALIRDALDRAVRAVNATIEKAVTAADATSPEAVLRACLYALISPAQESTRLMRFALAAAGRAVSDQTMARALAPVDDELLTFTAGLIAAAREERGSEPRCEERTDADICWSLATGLGVDIALGYRTPEAAELLLDHHVEQVLR